MQFENQNFRTDFDLCHTKTMTFDPDFYHEGVKIFKNWFHHWISRPLKLIWWKFHAIWKPKFSDQFWPLTHRNYDLWPWFLPWRSLNFQKLTFSLNFSTSKAFMVKISWYLKTEIFGPILTSETSKLWPLTPILTIKGSKFSKTNSTTEFLDLKSFSGENFMHFENEKFLTIFFTGYHKSGTQTWKGLSHFSLFFWDFLSFSSVFYIGIVLYLVCN